MFRLLVVIEHHLVGLASDTGLLVTAERRVRGIGVIAVGPDAARLDAPAEAIGLVDIPGPYTGKKPKKHVVRNFYCLLRGVKGVDRYHGPEYLLLEHSHLVVPFENRRENVVTAREIAR